jgi:hypothetical protein
MRLRNTDSVVYSAQVPETVLTESAPILARVQSVIWTSTALYANLKRMCLRPAQICDPNQLCPTVLQIGPK